MRSSKLLLLVLFSWYSASTALADFNIGNKKATKRNQIALERSIDALTNQAELLFEVEDSFDHAIEILKEAYFQADQANYTKGIIKSANLLGDGYLVKTNFSNSTSKYYIAVRHAETIRDSSSVAKAYRGLGLVKFNMKQWAEAISNFNKSRDFKTYGEDSRMASIVDYLLGLSYYQLGRYEVAENALFTARKAAQAVGDSMRLFEIDLNLNNIEVERTNSPSVLAVYDKLYTRFEQRNEKIGMCYARLGKAKSYLKNGDLSLAVLNVNEALEMARTSNLNYPIQEVLEVAVNAEYEVGNFKKSADLLLELQAIKESTLSESTSTKVAMLSADYEFEKKEAFFNDQIVAKNKQRLLLIGLVIAFFLISLIIFLSFKSVAKERRRSDELLYNILPVETAKELKANGVAVAKAHAKVTIVFADVQNFTKIAGDLEPRVLVQLLDYYFGKFDHIIQTLGLEKIKTIGDAYMFVSGLNSNNDENATNAVEAGVLMLRAIENSQNEVNKKFGAQFNFRIGMHTGKTVSGVVGKIKYAFDIWGDSVNIAARMEAHSEPGKINISEDTFKLVKHAYTCIPRGHVEVKNKGSMEMYFVDHKA